MNDAQERQRGTRADGVAGPKSHLAGGLLVGMVVQLVLVLPREPGPFEAGWHGQRAPTGRTLDLVNSASARELRALPGIGAKRALRIVDERHRRGGDFPPQRWSEIPGIGPLTVRDVQRWLTESFQAGQVGNAPGPWPLH